MPAGYNTHYLCRRETSRHHRHWIRKEDAIMKGRVPMCPDCGKRLSASPKRRKYKKGHKPWDIVIDDAHQRGQTHPNCFHCRKEMRYMEELEEKGRHGVFECMKCGCIFAWVSSFPVNKTWLTLVRGSPKCKTLSNRVNQTIVSKTKRRKRKKHNKKQREYRKKNEELCRARVRCSRAKAKQRKKK